VDAYTLQGYLALLELRLRQSSGVQFQDFFSDMMGRAHGSDFVPVRPQGQLGDKGCDGYLFSTGEVFACYGTVNGRTPPVRPLVKKIAEDAGKSHQHLPAIMKGWTFAHNFVDGVPTHAIAALKGVEQQVLKLPVTLFGLQRFRNLAQSLPEHILRDWLGPVLTEESVSSLDYAELRKVVDTLAATGLRPPPDLQTISPVSSEKLDFNQLNHTWQTLLLAGLRNARNVSHYFRENSDPMLGTRTAIVVRTKFLDLESQRLGANDILTELYMSVLGTVNSRPERQAAALALIGYMFETCTLLREGPQLIVS
jgi:hypothetical protein